MEKAKTFFAILGLGITIGVVLVVFLIFFVGARPKNVNVGGVEFEIPTTTPRNIEQGQDSAPTAYIPPSATIAPSSAQLVPECPSAISRQTIEQWAQAGQVSKSEAQKYINDFDRMRIKGEFKIGTILPAGVAVVTDFGSGESDIYLTLPVRAIAHYHSWGVFEVTSEYQAIQTGSCMTIVP